MSDTRLIAAAIVLATLAATWIFRYEPAGAVGMLHRNRITGAVCSIYSSCWLPDPTLSP
jgi:hypothetical protein